MRTVTTTKVQRGRRAPYWVVSGVCGRGFERFTDKVEADRYAAQLAYGFASQYALAA